MSTESVELIEVEVAYAKPETQVILNVKVERGATVEDAIKLSGILHNFSEIDLATNKVGVFGKLSKLNAPVKAGDRIEIYRHLIADPKEVRKQRAAQGKPMKKGSGGGEDKPDSTETA